MNCGDGTGVEVGGEDGKGLVVLFRERYEAEEVSCLISSSPNHFMHWDGIVVDCLCFVQTLDADGW
jgi:hypothetical protein